MSRKGKRLTGNSPVAGQVVFSARNNLVFQSSSRSLKCPNLIIVTVEDYLRKDYFKYMPIGEFATSLIGV